MAVPSFWYKVTSVQWVTLLVTDYATSCHQFVPSVIRHMLTVPYISGSGPSQPLLGSRWIHVWIRQQKTWSIRRWNYSGIMCIKNVLKIVPAQSGRPVCDSLSDGSRHWFSLPSVTSMSVFLSTAICCILYLQWLLVCECDHLTASGCYSHQLWISVGVESVVLEEISSGGWFGIYSFHGGWCIAWIGSTGHSHVSVG